MGLTCLLWKSATGLTKCVNPLQFCKGEANVKAFREKLQPFRETLQKYHFLGGTSPCYADIYLLGFFMVCLLSPVFPWPHYVMCSRMTLILARPVCLVPDFLKP